MVTPIICLLYIGSEVCRLIPALSLLKDGKMYKQQQKAFFENVRVCFEVKEGAAGMLIKWIPMYILPVGDPVY